MAAAREDHPHLPPGREPGAQSRRGRMGRRVAGCASPALMVGGIAFAAIVVAIGLLLASLSGGPPAWPFLVVAAGIVLAFGAIARGLWRGRHPRYASGIEIAVDRQEARRGESIAVTLNGDGELEAGLVCTERYDVWRRVGAADSQSRTTEAAIVWQAWTRAPHAALGARIELSVPADGPYSYEGECVSLCWAVVARRAGVKRGAAPVPVWVAP
jgi:hypothetical protein